MGISKIMQPLRRAVFLDRDGVVNEAVLRDGKPYPPASLTELRLTVGVEECLADLKRLGFLLIVVTNQPDVARGRQTKAKVEQMHTFLSGRLPIDDTYVCYHDDSARCACRKPEPGLLLEAARKHSVDLAGSFMIGDRWRDVVAGHRAGCRTVFIDYDYAETRSQVPATAEVGSLRGAVEWIEANLKEF
jgi:D-glycero-D-manno-heptose 1,7-bisphosphate phosphatase